MDKGLVGGNLHGFPDKCKFNQALEEYMEDERFDSKLNMTHDYES